MSLQLNLQHNIDLQSLHSFALPATALNYACIQTLEDLPLLYQYLKSHPQPTVILGGGSNTIFCGKINALVIHNQLKGMDIIEQNAQHAWLECAAGENWHRCVQYCIAQNLAGIENLSLIPGSVGAAPVQNIGAYGAELSDCLESVTAFDFKQGDFCQLSAKDCELSYRDSIFKHPPHRGRYFITSIQLRLNKNHQFKLDYGLLTQTLTDMGAVDTPTLSAVSDAVIQIRQAKLPDPAQLANAGSFFKNPIIEPQQWAQLKNKHPQIISYPMPCGRVKVGAGWLLEACGWKGRRIGDLGCHTKQALIVVHYGGSNGDYLAQFIHAMTSDVWKKFAIKLTPEVNLHLADHTLGLI